MRTKFQQQRTFSLTHRQFRRLLTAPNSSNSETSSNVVPAKKWLEDEGKDFEKTLIPHIGTLSVVERAQIANCPCPYPLHRVPNDQKPHIQDV